MSAILQPNTVAAGHSARPEALPSGFDPQVPGGATAFAYDPLTGLGRVLSRVKIALMEALDRELVPLDITGAQYVILVNLASGQADSTTTLCKGVSYDPGAMTRMLDRLERKGLVQRSRCPNDRRKVKLELTAEGNALYPQVVAIAGRVMQRFLVGFAPHEVATLEALLARMLANA